MKKNVRHLVIKTLDLYMIYLKMAATHRIKKQSFEENN